MKLSRFKLNYLIVIPAIVISASGLVAILAWRAIEPTLRKNGFSRSIKGNIEVMRQVEKNEEANLISLRMNDKLYFQTKTVGRYWVTDFDLNNGHIVDLNIKSQGPLNSIFDTQIDSLHTKILLGNVPKLTIANGKSDTTLNFPSSILTRGIFVDTSHFIIRGFDTSVKGTNQFFLKYNFKTGRKLMEQMPILERTGDGGLSTDGFIKYDSKFNKIIYVSVYSNRIICLDTSLKVVYAMNTIDTVGALMNTSGKIDKVGRSTLTNVKPVRIINARGCVDDGKIYINSRLKSDNENGNDFLKNSVIDIYDIESRRYLSSFYIPYYQSERMSDFKVFDDDIVVLYKSRIVKYKIK